MVSVRAVVVGVVAVRRHPFGWREGDDRALRSSRRRWGDAARDKAEVEELAAGGRRPQAAAESGSAGAGDADAEQAQTAVEHSAEGAEPLRAVGRGQVHAGARSAADGGGLSWRRHVGDRECAGQGRAANAVSASASSSDRQRNASSAGLAVHGDDRKRDPGGDGERHQFGSAGADPRAGK